MEHLPKRTNLVHETVATIKDWIHRGMLSEILPGELHLKTQLGVGRDTLRFALKILEDDGWISQARKGQQRRVENAHLLAQENIARDQLPVTFVSPHHVEHRTTLLELEDTQASLAAQGRSLRFMAPNIFHLRHPERHLERLVQSHPSAAWILYISSEPIQRWFQARGLPTFLYELPFPDVKLPYVAPDWETAAFHAGVQLVRHGHRVIGILEYRERRPGLVAEERGLERALETAKPEGRLVVFKDDRSPPSVAKSLELAFSLQTHPTALVLTRAAQLLTCYSWLTSRGIRVPADVSLISLPNDSWFAELHPPVCHYEPDTKTMSRTIAQRVMELVNDGRVSHKSLRIPLEYCSGATIGPMTQSKM